MVVEKCQICRMQERVHESITERQKLTEEIRLRGRNICVIPHNHFVFEKVHRASRAKLKMAETKRNLRPGAYFICFPFP